MFDISKVQDISILHLYGEISLMEMSHIQKIIESFRRHQHHKILIDLAKVDHIHFQAVKHLAQEAQKLKDCEGEIKIANPNKDAKHMLKFTGADQYLKDYSSVADAILSFLRSPHVTIHRDEGEFSALPPQEEVSKESGSRWRRKTNGAFFH